MKNTSPSSNSTREVALDLIRGLSAVLVLLGHLRAFQFIDYGDTTSPGLVEKLFYFSTSLGHQAVIIFFVLSGYFVGGSALKSMNNGSWSWRVYLIKRLTRLWIVLLPALALTAALDFYGSEVLSLSGYDGEQRDLLNSGPNQPDGADYSALTLLGNILFLQKFYVPIFGTNTPLWSLAYEFAFYLIFPVGMQIVRSRSLKTTLYGIIALSIMAFVFPLSVWISFPIWLVGAIAFAAKSKISRLSIIKPVRVGLAIASILTGLVVTKLNLVTGDHFLGFCTTVTLVMCIDMDLKLQWLRRFSIWLSEISYTLYVIHFPILCLYFFEQGTIEQSVLEPLSFLRFTTISLILCIVSWLFWWVFERHTFRVQSFLIKQTAPQS